MRKLFLIAWKDVRLIFRDRAALVLMLLAPFVLTIGMGAITGRFSSSNDSNSISAIPVTLVNGDGAQLGNELVDLFQSPELASLVTPVVMTDLAAARQQVDNDVSAALIYIPLGFTDSIIPAAGSAPSAHTPVVQVEFYANPTRPTSSGILKTILEQFLSRVETGRIAGAVTVTQLLKEGLIDPASSASVGMSAAQEVLSASTTSSSLRLNVVTQGGGPVKFDILAYMAPGMALMFLMYTVTFGGRSLLMENRQGTLARMLISPTTPIQVLGGKVMGIFLTAVLQLLILIGGTTLLFRLQWGDSLGVLILVLAAAFAATGWGMLLAAFLNTPGQIANIGTSLMLIFGLLGGGFFDITVLPVWVQTVSRISPNAWGLEGFSDLARGGTLISIRTPIFALLIMGAVLFAVSAWRLGRRSLVRN